MPTITPFLWFDSQAEEAMNFYSSIFKRSKVVSVSRAQGKVMAVQFELEGQPVMALNGGPHFTFNESFSLFVGCETQQEMDEVLVEAHGGRRRSRPLRLAEGQVRLVLADRSDRAQPNARRQRPRESRSGHERDDADEQTRLE